jgi:hypothetical protein
MRELRLVFSATVIFASLLANAQPSSSPSYMDPDYRPTVAAAPHDVVGRYSRSSDPPIDIRFKADGTASIFFVKAPTTDEEFGSEHEFQGTWNVRNGWLDLTSDLGHVVFEFDPGASDRKQPPTLTAKHALRSALLLQFGTLSKVAGS